MTLLKKTVLPEKYFSTQSGWLEVQALPPSRCKCYVLSLLFISSLFQQILLVTLISFIPLFAIFHLALCFIFAIYLFQGAMHLFSTTSRSLN